MKLNFKNVALGIISTIILASVILFIVRLVQNINQPQMEYSEGLMQYTARLFGSGNWSWILTETPPYVVPFYPPVFYAVLGQLFQWFGESLVVGRLLVFTCSLVVMALIYLIVYEITKKKLYAVIAALLPLTQVIMQGWLWYIRADVPAIMFELAGLYLLIKIQRLKWIWLSMILFAVAFYTKQSAIAIPIGYCVYLFLNGFRKPAFIYAGSLIALIGIPLLIGSIVTHGGFFNEVILYQRTVPLFRDINTSSMYWYVILIPLIPVIGLALVFMLKNQKHIISMVAVVVLVINFVAVMRPGGGHPYFFETIFVWCIAAGLGIGEVLEKQKFGYILAFGVTVLTLVFNSVVVVYPDSEYRARVEKVVDYIQDAEYPILTENWGVVLDAGKLPYFDPFVFYNLSQLGYWDNSKVLADLENHKIEYVLTQYPVPEEPVQRLDPIIQQSISAYYHVVYDYSDYAYGFVLYEANNRQ